MYIHTVLNLQENDNTVHVTWTIHVSLRHVWNIVIYWYIIHGVSIVVDTSLPWINTLNKLWNTMHIHVLIHYDSESTKLHPIKPITNWQSKKIGPLMIPQYVNVLKTSSMNKHLQVGTCI